MDADDAVRDMVYLMEQGRIAEARQIGEAVLIEADERRRAIQERWGRESRAQEPRA